MTETDRYASQPARCRVTANVASQWTVAVIDTSDIHVALCQRRAMIVRCCEIGTTVCITGRCWSSSAPYLADNLIRQPVGPDVRHHFFEYRLRSTATRARFRFRRWRRRRMLGDPTETGATASPAGPDRKRLGRGRSAKPSTAVARLHLPQNLFRRIAAISTWA